MCWLAGLSWRLAECHGRGLNPGRLRRNARRAAHHPPWWLTVARRKKQCACRFDSQRHASPGPCLTTDLQTTTVVLQNYTEQNWRATLF